jgi:hypothetical protein
METAKALNALERELGVDPVQDAAQKLSAFMKWNLILDVYAELWPRLFRNDWKKGKGIWDVIESFFGRLSKYVPLWNISMESSEDLMEMASSYIPYELANPYDPEWMDDCESLTAKVLYEFCDPEGDSWEELAKKAKRAVRGPEAWVDGRKFREEEFKKQVEALPGGKGFMKAFELVRHETGFGLLDMTYDSFGDSCDTWDIENVRMAIEVGKEMNKYLDQALRAIRRYDACPQKLGEMIERVTLIWNGCIEEGTR